MHHCRRHHLPRTRIMSDRKDTFSFRRFIYINAKSSQGTIRYKLSSHVGIRSTRGNREYNEDRYQWGVLAIPPDGKQLQYFGIFDGHGGSCASDFASGRLHTIIEQTSSQDIPKVLQHLREMYHSPILEDWIKQKEKKNGQDHAQFSPPWQPFSLFSNQALVDHLPHLPRNLTLEQRLTLAFLLTDMEFFQAHPKKTDDFTGTTASVLLVDADIHNFYAPDSDYGRNCPISITVAHVGDTRILLCDTTNGKAQSLTVDHLPSDYDEAIRILASGGQIVEDSYGELRVMGRLAVTRSIGDKGVKKGTCVLSEPQVSSKELLGKDVAFALMVTDGLTNVFSDQEMVDIVKLCPDPTTASIRLIELAQQFGVEDNATAIVLRLPGWGTLMPDYTKRLREGRLQRILGMPLSSNFSLYNGLAMKEKSGSNKFSLDDDDEEVRRNQENELKEKDLDSHIFESFSRFKEYDNDLNLNNVQKEAESPLEYEEEDQLTSRARITERIVNEIILLSKRQEKLMTHAYINGLPEQVRSNSGRFLEDKNSARMFITEETIMDALLLLNLDVKMKGARTFNSQGIPQLMFKVVKKDPKKGDRLTEDELLKSCQLLDLVFVVRGKESSSKPGVS